jgi:hypothetical protein
VRSICNPEFHQRLSRASISISDYKGDFSAKPSFSLQNFLFYTGHGYRLFLRNLMGYLLLNRVAKPIRDVIAESRQEWNLPPHAHPNDAFSQLAQLSQAPAEFEFPRQELPQWFHFTGPYHSSASRAPVSFPDEKLTGKPLIYASMGTLQNRQIGVFRDIALACEELDAQLVISLGGSANDYGDRYQAVIVITAPSGVSWQIRTGWIVLLDSDIARFVTAFPERFGRQQ